MQLHYFRILDFAVKLLQNHRLRSSDFRMLDFVVPDFKILDMNCEVYKLEVANCEVYPRTGMSRILKSANCEV